MGRRCSECVVHGSEEESSTALGRSARSELVTGLVGDQLLEPHGQVRDAQDPDFLVILAGEHQP